MADSIVSFETIQSNRRYSQGAAFVPAISAHSFVSCYFESGSTIFISHKSYRVRFTECTFESGSKIVIGKFIPAIIVKKCIIPMNVHVFELRACCYFFFVRSSPNERVPIVPRCAEVYVWDGEIGWEITELFVVPKGVDVKYFHSGHLKNPHSLDILASMMWRNPRFRVVSFGWIGNHDHVVEFSKTMYCRHRVQVSILLVLLNGRVLPRDLIRGGGLADFLIG